MQRPFPLDAAWIRALLGRTGVDHIGHQMVLRAPPLWALDTSTGALPQDVFSATKFQVLDHISTYQYFAPYSCHLLSLL